MLIRIVLLLAALSGAALAEEPAPGKVASKVACAGTSYSYACYLPRRYTSSRRWPILYCFCPVADGPGYVKMCRAACERNGWIVVCSNDSKNGPLQRQAIEAVWKDTHRRFSIHPGRIYASGFSGGSRVATWFATERRARGNFAIGGVYLGGGKLPAIDYYLTCGSTDFNRKEMERARAELSGRKQPHQLRVFKGGHTWPPAAVVADAIAWHEGRWRKAAPVELREKLAALTRQSAGEPVAAYHGLRELYQLYQGVSGLNKAAGLMRKLRADARVKPEAAAMRAYEKLVRTEPQATSAAAKNALAARYRELAEQHPGTRAAKLALERASGPGK